VLREPATKVQDPVRFGDDFELDGGTCQLRRSGRVLKLERIPMEVLLLLVQQRGELVTREQIVEKIWGKDVYLDTDNGINGAIRKIRQALRDDPEQPRFRVRRMAVASAGRDDDSSGSDCSHRHSGLPPVRLPG
jgi:DNA-binding response OmpR family regulator